MPPYFALGWFITWFSHSVQQLDQISRLFDLFMASHPLMPLYVVAQVMMVSFQLCAHISTCLLKLRRAACHLRPLSTAVQVMTMRFKVLLSVGIMTLEQSLLCIP